jgi:hypothetical protein
MAYGLDLRLFVENGPAVTAAEGHGARSSEIYRAWRKLEPQRRLDLVERALKPANDDTPDGYPIAL